MVESGHSNGGSGRAAARTIVKVLVALVLSSAVLACNESQEQALAPSVDPSRHSAAVDKPQRLAQMQPARLEAPVKKSKAQELVGRQRLAAPAERELAPSKPRRAQKESSLRLHYRVAVMVARQMIGAVKQAGGDCAAVLEAVRGTFEHYPGEFQRRMKSISAAPADAPEKAKNDPALSKVMDELHGLLQPCPEARKLLDETLSAPL